MSPAQLNDQQATKEINNGVCPSPLKVNKDSHAIKKPSPSSSSSSSSSYLNNGVASTAAKTQPRHPIIIYTHSPKIIHTHPRDFMALVQKLTGLSRPEDTTCKVPQDKIKLPNFDKFENGNKNSKIGGGNEDNESTSVVTDDNGSCGGDAQVNSCFVPPTFDPPNPGFNNIPFFAPSSSDFLLSAHHHQQFYNYSDSMFLMPNMRSSVCSSALEGMKEFPEY